MRSPTHLLNVIARPGNPFEAMRHLLRDNPEDAHPGPSGATRWHLRSLLAAGSCSRWTRGPDAALSVHEGLRSTSPGPPLSTYALATLETLDPEAPTYALDVCR